MAVNTLMRSRRSAAQLHAIASVEREIRTIDPASRRKYLRDFREAYCSYERVLAASDVRYLSQAFVEHYAENSNAGIDQYSARALARVWKAERFSWWMTMMLHRISDNSFDHKIQLAELDYLFRSKAAMTVFAENYVGLPH